MTTRMEMEAHSYLRRIAEALEDIATTLEAIELNQRDKPVRVEVQGPLPVQATITGPPLV